MSFTKLDGGIVDSTLWMQPHDVLRVWIAMMAKANAQGYVRASVPSMAHLCMVPIERLEQILAILTSPDPYSRSPVEEGRRLRVVDGGWEIINYEAYRNARDPEARREAQREWDRENRPSGQARAKKRGRSPTGEPQSDSSPTVRQQSDAVRDGPTQAEAEAEERERECAGARPPPDHLTSAGPVGADLELPPGTDREAWHLWLEQLTEDGKASYSRIRNASVQLWAVAKSGHDPTAVLQSAIARGHRDLLAVASSLKPSNSQTTTGGEHATRRESAAGRAERLGNEAIQRLDGALTDP